MNILDELVAKGVAGDVVVAVAQLIADAKLTQDRRAKNAERMKAVRTHAPTSMHTETQGAAFLSKKEKVYPKKEESKKDLKKESRAKPKTVLPPDWQPIGDQRDPTEADEFRDHARAKGYRYSDWNAAYRNFQRSPYNARNKASAPQQASVLNFAAGFDARTRMQLAERAEIERQRKRP